MENGVWLQLEVSTEIVIGVMAKVSGGGKVVLTCYGHWTCPLSPLNVSVRNKLHHFYLSFTRLFFSLYMLQVEAKDPETMAPESARSLSSVRLIAHFIY